MEEEGKEEELEEEGEATSSVPELLPVSANARLSTPRALVTPPWWWWW